MGGNQANASGANQNVHLLFPNKSHFWEYVSRKKNTKYRGLNANTKIFIAALFIAKIKCIYIETNIQQENAMQPLKKKKFYINIEKC